MSDKLKPCPFCGGEAEDQWTHHPVKINGILYTYWCKFCHATIDYYETKTKATKAWNTRKPDVQELVAALQYIAERDYISVMGTVDSLQKWHREFNDVAKQALEAFEEVSDE